jgi:type I restriction enzyme M protein
LKTCQEAAQANLEQQVNTWVSAISNNETLSNVGKTDVTDEAWQAKIEDIVRGCARLDGYNVNLKVSDPQPHTEQLPESKGWTAPVRVWLKDDEWQNEEKTIQGSHTEVGNIRPEYMIAMTDSGTGSVSSDALDSECIEANDYNLTANRYKPDETKYSGYEPPEQLIQAIKQLESEIQSSLTTLMTMLRSE